MIAGLTILRAYVRAGRPATLSPFGNFDDWSWVRGALVSAGRADPVATREAILANDPQKGELVEVMDAWESAFGDRAVVPGEIGPPSDYREYFPYRELCDLLRAVACGGKEFSPKKVGKWLSRYVDRVVGERCFVRDEHNKRRWRLEAPSPCGSAPSRWTWKNGAGSEGKAKPSKTGKPA